MMILENFFFNGKKRKAENQQDIKTNGKLSCFGKLKSLLKWESFLYKLLRRIA